MDSNRKRLLWRATHRGIKEMDLILGGFATARLAGLSEGQLAELAAIVEMPDQLLLAWATRQEAVPETVRSPLLMELIDFRP